MWKKRSLFQVINNHVIDFPTPINLNYFWVFGSLAFMCLISQLLTGIFLAMHYTPHIDYAFLSVEHIMRDVNNGWLLRYLHANGASFFFISIYVHIGRGLYYGSFQAPRHWLWATGVILLVLTMAAGFMGYVLPWGQMSFWAATVITNLFSALPFIGEVLVQWLWGGFSVDNATLNRFFSLHYLIPFLIVGLSLLHLVLVHHHGNNNPFGIDASTNMIKFYPYSLPVKYVFAGLILFLSLLIMVCFSPNYLGHTDNYIPANPMVTPTHIVPEWYFLPYYAILRSIPDKVLGVAAMGGSLLTLAIFPFLMPKLSIRSSVFRILHRKLFWFIVVDFIILTWIGQETTDSPYMEVGQIATLFYFLYFLVLIPGIAWLETKMILSYSEK